jgi:proteasome lid subunit RPN8/RPN11
MMITLNTGVYETITQDALHSFPNECCGFLFGHEASGRRIITQAMVVNNAKEGDKKRRFEISATDYMKAEQFALEHDAALLGIYHSHPLHPAIPSETDRLSAQPFFSYIIISVSEKNIEQTLSWQLNEERIFESENISIPQTMKQ